MIVRPAYILGGRGTGIASQRGRVPPARRRRAGGEPDRRDPHRGVDRRLEGVRARGDARSRRQLRDHLLDRERRSDGCAHRRLDHRRPGADAQRRRVPGDAQRRVRLHPARRRRDRRIERAVRPRSGHRAPGDHRDEPAGVALVGAGVQGDRIPDRQDRHQARRRLHARRDPQRHHPPDAGVFRAVDRLRRHQGAALGVREAPRHERGARDADAVGRRGDGDRADVSREPAEGAALAGAGPTRSQRRPCRGSARRTADGRAAQRRRNADARADLPGRRADPARCDRRAGSRRLPHRRVVPRPDRPDRRGAGRHSTSVGGADRMERSIVAPGEAARVQRRPAGLPVAHRRRHGARRTGGGRRAADVQDRRHVRRRVRRPHAVPLLDVGGRGRDPPVRSATRHHPRFRSEPHRPGHRVRLLLRACQLRPVARPATRR